MICEKCGNRCDDDKAFCHVCGTILVAPIAPAESMPDFPPMPPADAAPARDPFAARVEEGAAKSAKSEGAADKKPDYKRFFGDDQAPIISTGNWFSTMLMLILLPPFLAAIAVFIAHSFNVTGYMSLIFSATYGGMTLLIMLISAFSRRNNPSKRHFFRALLLLCIIFAVIAYGLIWLLVNNFNDIYMQLQAAELVPVLDKFLIF